MANEVELKLACPFRELPKLERHPALEALSQEAPASTKLYSVYYDTPELDLWRRGLTLRLRRERGRWVQTVKGEGSAVSGLHRRSEWSVELTGERLDLSRVDSPALKRLLASPRVRRGLAPVFVTEFVRSSRYLRFPDGALAELCIDQGQIAAEGSSRPISEIELELARGEPVRLYELALALQEAFPLEVEIYSKAERGYQLATGMPPPAVKARPPKLLPAMSVSDAFKAVACECLEQLQRNAEGMLRGTDSEYLHQMRVALRRLRSALRIFSPAFPKGTLTPVEGEIKGLAGSLAPARDWDVFVDETLPPVLAAFPGHPGLAALAESAHRLGEAACAAARQAVACRHYHRLMLALGAWLEAAPWLEGPGGANSPLRSPVAAFSREVLEKQHRKVLKRGKHPGRLEPAELHRLRIATKRLRYAAEFFSVLYPGKQTREYIKGLQCLQDVLGALNDSAQASRLAVKASQGAGREPVAAARIVGEWVAQAAKAQRLALGKTWDRFAAARPFW